MAEPPFQPKRLALSANTITSVTPPRLSDWVHLINEGDDEIYVYVTEPDAQAHADYLRVPIGFERGITLPPSLRRKTDGVSFHPNNVAFWLKTPQDGTVVLIWF